MKRIQRSEDGLTFVELLIGIVIMTMITGGIAAALVTSFNVERPNGERIRQSNDAQVIASFLVRDAQAAGGTNPNTVVAYTSLSGFPAAPSPVPVPGVYLPPLSANISSYCAAPGTAVAQFNWNDRASDTVSHGHVVIYSLSANQLVRTACVDGPSTPSTSTLGGEIASATASIACDQPSCPAGLPTSVTLDITSTKPTSSAAYHYKLTATLRPDNNQGIPTNANASPVPLLTLGGAGCTSGLTTGVDVGGNPTITVYGQVTINSTDTAGCPAMNLHGSIQYSSGAVSILDGGTCSGNQCVPYSNYSTPLTDPYASTLGPLKDACTGGSNPAQSPPGKYLAGASPMVFQNTLNLGTAFFGAGIYVFCQGINAGTITTPPPASPGVTFYIVNGGFNQAGGASTSINGLVYAPTSVINISGNGDFAATSIVAAAVVVQGVSTVVIGIPPAVNIAITGVNALPAWTVNRAYPVTHMTATGGGGIYAWSADLPPGLSINAATGDITGTVAAPVTYVGSVTVVDSLGDTATRPYTVVINVNPTITGPATLTDWTINRDYPGTTIIATNGTTPYAWSAANLPAGLAINATTGVVSGTPTATGTSNATITLTDASGVTATRNYTIKINATPTITGPATLATWTANSAGYPNQTMTATNGTLPYTWAASGLPTGLVINAGSGVISGTPNAAGTFSVAVTVTDKAGASNTKNYTVTINPAPGIATANLPTAEVGRPYNFTLTPTGGGTPPYTWSLPTKPAWLNINTATGTLTGTPPAAATTTVTVRITDSTGAFTNKNYSLTVAAAVQISGPATLPNWTVNRDYPGTTIIGTGGVTPFTWSATGLTAGLTINPATGVISGTPSANGTSTIVVTVVDANGGTDTQNYTVTINVPPTISTASLPNGEQTVAYSTTLAAANGTAPYSWAASGLPAGLGINATTGVLSGTPTTAGTFSVTISATDTAGASVSAVFNLTLATTPSGSGTLPNWTVNRPYPNPQIFGSGGTGPYTYTATNLPTGLTIGLNTGIVSGTPTAAGTKAVTVTVHDSFGAIFTLNLSVTINAAPVITTASLPTGTIGFAYPSTTVTATGGTAPFGWSATGLPPGLVINAGTGAISGTPTATGTFNAVVVSLVDSAGATATHAAYTITIRPAATVTSTTPSSLGQGATAQVVAINGTNFVAGAPLAAAFSGTGITVNSVTFVNATKVNANITISGTATTGAQDVTLTNGDGSTATGTGVFTVNPAPTVTSINPPSHARGGAAFNITITGNNFVAGSTVAFSGARITLNSTTFVDATTLTVNVTIAGNTQQNARDVTVTNPDFGTTTVTGGFTVT